MLILFAAAHPPVKAEAGGYENDSARGHGQRHARAGYRHVLGEAGIQRVLVIDDCTLSTSVLAAERRQRVVVVVDDRGGVARAYAGVNRCRRRSIGRRGSGAAAATGAAVITVVPGTVTTRSVSMICVRRMVICELSSSFTSR